MISIKSYLYKKLFCPNLNLINYDKGLNLRFMYEKKSLI